MTEIRTRMARISGKSLHKLSLFQLQGAIETELMEYFNVIIKDKNLEVKTLAVHNLPCFYLHFRNVSEANSAFFDSIYLDFAKDETTPIEILKSLASSIHEPLKVISKSESLGYLKQALHLLMDSSHKEVRFAFASNID